MNTAKDTEQRLLDSALTLFSQKGYAATSVREIIEAAEVTRPVLYYYFPSKEALFARLIQATHRDAYEELGAALALDVGCEDRLRRFVRGSFAFCAKDPRLPRLLFHVAYGPPTEGVAEIVAGMTAVRFGLIVWIFREALATGEVRGGSPESLALAFCCLMDQHINVLCSLPNPEFRLTQELADALVMLFLHGAGNGERKNISLPTTPLT